MMIKCAFYGTLRPPLYNYEKIVRIVGKEQMIFLETYVICGYEMYLVNPNYPGIKDSTLDKKITVDLFDVGPDAYTIIDRMETFSGYYEDDVMINNQSYKIYIYGKKVDDMLLIESGNYLQFCNCSSKKKDHVNY